MGPDTRRLEEENRRLRQAVERLSETVRAQRVQLRERVPVRLDTTRARQGVEDALRAGIEAHLRQHRGLILGDQAEALAQRLLSRLKELNRTHREAAECGGEAGDGDGDEREAA